LNDYDVVIVGGGNAALTAAITCAENGRKALLLESAPLLERVEILNIQGTYDTRIRKINSL